MAKGEIINVNLTLADMPDIAVVVAPADIAIRVQDNDVAVLDEPADIAVRDVVNDIGVTIFDTEPFVPPNVAFVAASQASSPVDHVNIPFGVNIITIPVPVGVQVGDEMFVSLLTSRPAMTVNTSPGWTLLQTEDFNYRSWLYQKTADASDAAGGKSYSWDHTLPPPSNFANFTGVMIAFRNASPVLENLAFLFNNIGDIWNIPSIISTVDGSAYCTFCNGSSTPAFDPVVELTPTAPLLEGAEHTTSGAIKQDANNTGVFYIENIGIETVAAQEVTADSDGTALRHIYVFILNPA